MRVTNLSLLALALSAPLTIGCKSEREVPPITFKTSFVAESDGEPLAGVNITVEGKAVGTTDETGALSVDLTGQEGTTVTVRAECPNGFRAAQELPRLRLHRFRGLRSRDSGLEMTIECPPTERELAVIVRAGTEAGIPVVIHGREVARTNAAGVAHLYLAMAPNSDFRLTLDTTEHPALRPQNPSMSFTVPDSDEVMVFDQPFERTPEPRPARRQRRAAPPPPSLPVKILTHSRWPGRRG